MFDFFSRTIGPADLAQIIVGWGFRFAQMKANALLQGEMISKRAKIH
jgi:hypothetical protein